MFWEKKSDRKTLPELPPLRPFSSFELPKKEEILENNSDLSEDNQDFKEELPELPSKFKLPKIEDLKLPAEKTSSEMAHARTEDVYVKIDRFHSARKALNSAREKLKEIEESMKKIRETRMREEQELSSWENEIQSIKTKVEDVTKNIFEKVE
ncbi:hypothetical protein J4229_00580 [Candidatus Pacearchaeota archaeon]|nr:hypothetical protein [Candidatus Pacearchaeota archaeon]